MPTWNRQIKLLLALAIATNSSSCAFADSNKIENLKNLAGGCTVFIEKLPTDALKFGVSEERLKTITELKLMQNGLKLVPTDLVKPIVDVQVSALGDDQQLFYLLDVSVVTEVVTLVDAVNESKKPEGMLKRAFESTIWSKSKICLAGKLHLPQNVYSELEAKVEELIHDYLKSKQSK